MGRGRKQCIWKKTGIVTIIIFLAAGSLWYFCVIRPDHKEMIPDKTDMEGSAYPDGSGIVTATGVTENGIDTVTFAIDFLEDTNLYVEDVYLSDGDIVTAGEKYIKFTDDSMEKARVELEKAVQDTELAYRSRIITNGEDKIQAKYTYDTALLEAGFAPQIYQDTLTQLEMQLVKAEKTYEEAQNEYSAYYSAVENNTFYEDYQIEKLKKAYDDAYDLLTRRAEYWEVTQEELGALSKNTDHENRSFEQSDRQWIVRTVALLKDKMTEAQQEYEQAKQGYQREIEGAELKLQKLLNQLERAQQSLVDAQLEHQKGTLHAKTLYELSVARGQIAESDYQMYLMGLDEELEHLKDAKEKAIENQEMFEKLIGDGYLYTERAGKILKANAQKGQALAGGDQILAYINPEDVQDEIILCNADGQKAQERGIVSPMYDLDIYDWNSLTESQKEYADYLKIAEVYVETGQHVKEGDPVCQFTPDSIEKVRKALAYARSDAQRALMKARTDYHTGVLEAGLLHNEALVSRTLAQTAYDNTIAKLNSGRVEKILETEQLLAEIYQLQTDLTDDAHQRQRADAANAYDQAKKQVEKARNCFVTSQVEAARTLQAAKDSYEDFFNQLEKSNQQIADKVEKVHLLQEEILQGQQLMEKELLTAEQTRISAQTEGNIASVKYAGILKEYENAVQKAQSDLEQATQKLDYFNRFMEDGIVYATGNGLVTKVGYKKGDLLDDARKLVFFMADDSVEENRKEDTQ